MNDTRHESIEYGLGFDTAVKRWDANKRDLAEVFAEHKAMYEALKATQDAIKWVIEAMGEVGADVPEKVSQAVYGLSLQMDANSAAIAKAEGR
jgi:predicted RNase H-like HicB family nuclease